MPGEQEISTHYTHGDLTAAIRSGIEKLGKTIDSVTVDDLAPVDEFHIGGRQASEHFLDQFGLTPDNRILDVGCGLGGPARFVASRYGCRVDGIDLTPEYVETGTTICKWVGLDDRISLHRGSALSMPFADGSFDGAYMLHVGMNIEDKAGLCAEVGRVLRPSALFGIYDVMKTGDGEMHLSGTMGNHGRVKRPRDTPAIPRRIAGGRLFGDGRTQSSRLRCRVL